MGRRKGLGTKGFRFCSGVKKTQYAGEAADLLDVLVACAADEGRGSQSIEVRDHLGSSRVRISALAC